MRRKGAEGPGFNCPECSKLAEDGHFGTLLKKGKTATKGEHRSRVGPVIDCSVNLEAALDARNEGVFDYLMVVEQDCRIVMVEVHPASSTGNVDDVCKKKTNTATKLEQRRVDTAGATWIWLVPGGKINFHAGSRYGKQLAKAGIRQPCRKWK